MKQSIFLRGAAALLLAVFCVAGGACAGTGEYDADQHALSDALQDTYEEAEPETEEERDPSYLISPGEQITLEGEAPAKTVFTQTYARYAAVRLTDLDIGTNREADADILLSDVAELLDEAAVRRDKAVERALDITLENEYVDDLAGTLTLRRQAGEQTADFLHFASAQDAASLCASGALADMASLGSLRLDNASIDSSLTGALTLAGRCYFLFGDATLANRTAAAALLVDTEAARRAGLPLDEITARVRGGEWTIEAMLSYVTEGGISLDGDAVLPLLIGAGSRLFDKDGEDIPALCFDERFSLAYSAMQTAMAVSASTSEGAAEREAVFSVGTLGELRPGLLALPIPAAEAGAKPYRTAVDSSITDCIAVPADPADPTRTGNILTAYFEQSSDTVAEVIGTALLEAECSGGGDEALLDLILENRTCSHGVLFGWGDIADALAASAGLTEQEFLDRAEMRFAAAERAMEILLSRLR